MSKKVKSKVKETTKEVVKVANPKVDQALLDKAKKGQKDLEDYFKKHDLDPTKDHTKSKKHGEAVKKLLAVLNVTRDKIKDAAPAEKHHSKKDDPKKEKVEKVKKERTSKPVKYDYPKVDGREMTSGEKKKYRVKMRSGSTDKPVKDTVAKPVAKVEKKTDKAKATAKVEKVDAKKSGKKSDKAKATDKKQRKED